MNDVMSFGIHRLWKHFALSQTALHRGQLALDLAGGTGDLACKLSAQVGPEGKVVLADINGAMLVQGRSRLLDKGIADNVEYVQADAENLPFKSNQFYCITMAFGLRNVTNKEKALAECLRVLRPSGRLLVLEFSRPVLKPLAKLYDLYSFNLIPRLGQWITGDQDSYQYLVESIRMHPDQDTLAAMMQAQGFDRTQYYNLSGGIVALHKGFKF
jgi:demethylmenaquinone methyltransferase/2-methoxy-6-polyprenyl-1,4-benzoquinol methylase